VAAGALAAAFFSVFFALCFLALCFGAVCAACADGSLEAGAGAGAASAAHAGTTIKANNNSNKFFMITLLCSLKKQLRLALCGSLPATNNKQQNQLRSAPPCMLTRPV
jgi:hypothetical protein